MPLYESVFIARQDISAPQVEALADTFAKIIEDQGGTVAKREHWGLRGLAYRIKKNRKGHYVLFNLDAPADAIQEMQRQMTIHEDVLRYLTLRMDELDPEPSVIMQRGASRDDRDRDRGRPRRHGADAAPPRDSKDAGRGSAGKTDAPPAKAPAEAPAKAKDEAAGKTDAAPAEAPAKAPAKAKDDAAGKTDAAPAEAPAEAPAKAKDDAAGKTDGDKAEGDKK